MNTENVRDDAESTERKYCIPLHIKQKSHFQNLYNHGVNDACVCVRRCIFLRFTLNASLAFNCVPNQLGVATCLS